MLACTSPTPIYDTTHATNQGAEITCQVHEVGEVDGRPCIAMQFIEGRDLLAAADRLTLERKVALLRQVCDAVHAAHRIGLIHRDLKPANVLAVADDEGDLTPFVTDFGLARDGPARSVTRQGFAVGTPGYMAPEQARGEYGLQDRRTDVFGLGVMLYELITGALPFTGETPAVAMLATITKAPASPRSIQPSTPIDLEAIVLKCLEKQPQDRYESARALGDDLQRFLDGEPVMARPPSVAYRFGKLVRRHRATFAVGSAGLLVVGILGVMQVRGELRSRRQAQLARRLGQDVKEIESTMRFAAMLPLHDINRERAILRRQMEGIQHTVAASGALGVGPGEDALGRGFLVLGDLRRAREHLERAWRSGYREADVAFALGRTLGAVYRQELAELERTEGPGGLPALRRELEVEYREPALGFLRQARGGLARAGAEYAEALLAYYDRRFDEALTRLDTAGAASPWLHEALTLRGDTLLQLGNASRQRGELEAAAGLFDRANTAYEAAIDRARSDPDAYLGLCELRGLEIYLALDRDLLPEPAYRGAMSACKDALRADPQAARAHNALANAHKRWAGHLAARGQDPTDPLRLSIAAASRALELDPDYAYALLNVGVGHRMLAERAALRGEEPGGELDQAIACFERAEERAPSLVHAANNLGLAHLARGRWRAGDGDDPTADLAAAAGAFRAALDREPGFYHALVNLADVAQERARLTTDPDEAARLLDSARQDLHCALSLNPHDRPAFVGLARAALAAARLVAGAGDDPQALIDEAREAVVRLAAAGPGSADTARLQREIRAVERSHGRR